MSSTFTPSEMTLIPTSFSMNSSNDDVTMSNTTVAEELRPLAERLTEGFILLTICILAVGGNLFLWVVVLRYPDLHTASNYLLLSLSSADLLVSAINMPITVFTIFVGDWVFSDSGVICMATGFSNMLAFVASVLSLCTITFNRYIRVCWPNRYEKMYDQRGVAMHIGGLWLVAFLLSIPPLFGWSQYRYIPTQYFCYCVWDSSLSYTIFMIAVCFGGTSSVMTSLYFAIYRKYTRSKRNVSTNEKCAMMNSPLCEKPKVSSRRKWNSSQCVNTTDLLNVKSTSAWSRKPSSACLTLSIVSAGSENGENIKFFSKKGSIKGTQLGCRENRQLKVNFTCPNFASLSNNDQDLLTLDPLSTRGQQGTQKYFIDDDEIPSSPSNSLVQNKSGNLLNQSSKGLTSMYEELLEGGNTQMLVKAEKRYVRDSEHVKSNTYCIDSLKKDTPESVDEFISVLSNNFTRGTRTPLSEAETETLDKNELPVSEISKKPKVLNLKVMNVDLKHRSDEYEILSAESIFQESVGGINSPVEEEDVDTRSKEFKFARKHFNRGLSRSLKSIVSYLDIPGIPRIPTSTSLGSQSGSSSTRIEKRKRAEMRLTFTMVLVIFIYVISWLPYCITILLNIVLDRPLPRQVDMLVIILGYSNSMCNPLIYGWKNSSLQSGYKRLLKELKTAYKKVSLKPKSKAVFEL